MGKMSWNEIDGWFSSEDAKFVENICKKIHNGTIVEIGLFKGRSTAVMMPIAIKNKCRYVAIDNFFGGIDELTPASKVQRSEGAKIKEIFIGNMEDIGINRSQYSLYQCNSIDAIKYFQDESIDLVFIDGDHAYESIKKDLESWHPKVKANGIISGHDFNNAEVNRAITEFFNQKIFTGGNCWAINKREKQ